MAKEMKARVTSWPRWLSGPSEAIQLLPSSVTTMSTAKPISSGGARSNSLLSTE